MDRDGIIIRVLVRLFELEEQRREIGREIRDVRGTLRAAVQKSRPCMGGEVRKKRNYSPNLAETESNVKHEDVLAKFERMVEDIASRWNVNRGRTR